MVASALDFFGDSASLSQQPQHEVEERPRSGPHLGKHQRGGGAVTEDSEDSECESEADCKQHRCESEDELEDGGGVALLTGHTHTSVGEVPASRRRKKKKKKLSRETKELLRRQEVI